MNITTPTPNRNEITAMIEQPLIPNPKNQNAVALGRLNRGKPRRTTPELSAKRRELMAQARAALAVKRAAEKTLTDKPA